MDEYIYDQNLGKHVKEASRGKYILVFTSSNILLNMLGYLFLSISDYYLNKINHPTYADIFINYITFVSIGLTVSAFMLLGIYKRTGNIRYTKVAPYIIGFGILYIVFGVTLIYLTSLSFGSIGKLQHALVGASITLQAIYIGTVVLYLLKFERERTLSQSPAANTKNQNEDFNDNHNQPQHKHIPNAPSSATNSKVVSSPVIDEYWLSILKSYPKAKIKIEYVPEVNDLWIVFKKYPHPYREALLGLLNTDKNVDLFQIKSAIHREFVNSVARFDDKDLDLYFSKAILLGIEYENEFIRVAPVLQGRYTAKLIFDKVICKVNST